jgi:murein hydrolase activator
MLPPSVPRMSTAAFLAIAAACLLSPASAQDAAAPTDALEATRDIPASELDGAAQGASADLEAVQDEISLTEERIAEIRAEIQALSGDSDQLRLELVAAGERIALADVDVRVIEDRLQELFASEESVRTRLDGHDRSISNLLASLQRISASPPPAIIVDPTDALGSARAAMLLSAVLPQLQDRAGDVVDDLNALTALKDEALEEAELLNANLNALNEERLRIATIIEARTQGMEWLSEDLLREEAEAQALADRATSIEQLIAGLETRIAAVTAASEANRAASAGEALPALDPQTIAIAFADTTRTEPAVPLASARGYLTAPVSGVNVLSYGASDGFGGRARGLSVVTQADAPVKSPADGWIVFTGPFLNYGQIVILNAGQDYNIVLAGLERIDVESGAFVKMGDPIGVMGSQTAGHTVATSAGVSSPTLYIELREDGVPIDPSGWWTAEPETLQNGSS